MSSKTSSWPLQISLFLGCQAACIPVFCLVFLSFGEVIARLFYPAGYAFVYAQLHGLPASAPTAQIDAYKAAVAAWPPDLLLAGAIVGMVVGWCLFVVANAVAILSRRQVTPRSAGDV